MYFYIVHDSDISYEKFWTPDLPEGVLSKHLRGPSVCLSVRPCVRPSVCLSVCLFVITNENKGIVKKIRFLSVDNDFRAIPLSR